MIGMKKLLTLFSLLVVVSGIAATIENFTESDKINGIWLIQDKDAKIKVYRAVDGKYYGKIVWLKIPNDANGKPRTDIHNEDEKLQTRPLMGLLILRGFVYDAEEKEYVDGTVYSSKNGNTYSGYLVLQNPNQLYMKGYVMGMRWLGKDNTWTRTTE